MCSDSIYGSIGQSVSTQARGTTIMHQVLLSYLSWVLSMALCDPKCPRWATPGQMLPLRSRDREKKKEGQIGKHDVLLTDPNQIVFVVSLLGSPPWLHLLARTLTTLVSQQKARASGGQLTIPLSATKGVQERSTITWW